MVSYGVNQIIHLPRQKVGALDEKDESYTIEVAGTFIITEFHNGITWMRSIHATNPQTLRMIPYATSMFIECKTLEQLDTSFRPFQLETGATYKVANITFFNLFGRPRIVRPVEHQCMYYLGNVIGIHLFKVTYPQNRGNIANLPIGAIMRMNSIQIQGLTSDVIQLISSPESAH